MGASEIHSESGYCHLSGVVRGEAGAGSFDSVREGDAEVYWMG